MRKVLMTGVAAVLALGLTACNGNGDSGSAAPSSSSPAESTPAPSGTTTPDGTSTPDAPSAPASTPQEPSGSDTPNEQPIGQQINSKWGELRYLAPGKFLVGDIIFFTAVDTVLYVAGGTCPDGTTPPDDSKCSIDGFEEWVKEAPHNASVQFSGSAATVILETQ